MGLTQPRRVVILASNSTSGEDGDAYTYIRAQGVCRRVEITECPPAGFTGTYTLQGLNYIYGPQWDPNYGTPAATVHGLPAVEGKTILINDLIQEGPGGGRTIGHPAMAAPATNPATVFAKIKSATATGTAVLVKEYA